MISEAPPGFENQQLLLENRSRHTPKAEIKYKSFCDVVSCGASSSLYPPDITISAPQSHSRGHSIPTLTTEKKKEKLSEVDHHLAQKIKYLLSYFPDGLPVREISLRLDIRAAGGLTPNAQVGAVVKKLSSTFSLTTSSADGIVKLRSDAVRPSSSDASNYMRGKEDDSSKWPRPIKTIMFQLNSYINVLLIDEGITVSVSNAQLKPLFDHYHEIPPFAICCTVGDYDTFYGKRLDFLRECKQIVEYFMGADIDGLEMEVLDKIHDGEDKLKVRLTYFGRKEVCIPDYLIQKQLISLQ
ncbi:hypothetical protein KIN20_033538 [Parelaphostrongylus tenuis]|uniref:Tudor domain-containing protein n=1 Tax=Parelaphostrongylus tenuis TaxID=148309 RepID=A0AAD5R8J1_PARTN|nr:hypothetical protein KIN20_033538 [Parelaphostrongylus tenuis]